MKSFEAPTLEAELKKEKKMEKKAVEPSIEELKNKFLGGGIKK